MWQAACGITTRVAGRTWPGCGCLPLAASPRGAADMCAMPDPPGFEREIVVAAGDAGLPGHLVIPERAGGMVVFAHGSGSSRRSPRQPVRRCRPQRGRPGHASGRPAHAGGELSCTRIATFGVACRDCPLRERCTRPARPAASSSCTNAMTCSGPPARTGPLTPGCARTTWLTGPMSSAPSPRSPPSGAGGSSSTTGGGQEPRLAQAAHRRTEPANLLGRPRAAPQGTCPVLHGSRRGRRGRDGQNTAR